MSTHTEKKPRNPRFQCIKSRKMTMLSFRINKLKEILRTGKITKFGKVVRDITEVEIEKYGFKLEQCESEYQKLSRGQEA